MYEITIGDQTATADTIPAVLAVLREQLSAALSRDDGIRWSVNDPAGLEYRGITYLNGRLDCLQDSVDGTCDHLYVLLHQAADGYRIAGVHPPVAHTGN